MATFAKKVLPPRAATESVAFGLSTESVQRWPALCEHLTLDQWDDGAPRQTGKLSFFCQEGELKVCLADPDNERVAFLTVSDLLRTLDALETGLQQSSLDWRRAKPFPGQKRRRGG